MANEYSEDLLVQETTANYLKNELQWDESIHAEHETLGKEGTLGRSHQREVVLTRYLGEKLIEFNPGLPNEVYLDAIRILSEESGSTMLQTNRDKYALHKKGVEVAYRDDKGERVTKHLRLFDFKEPANNHFLVVREFWIKGDFQSRRADIVGFVNGIPLLFMELKNIDKDLRAAFEQNLIPYKADVPHLFHHNAFIVLGNGDKAKIGSLSSKYEYFNEWKRLHEEEPGVVDMETLLKGTCSKAHLMDIFENFIVFDESSGNLAKILARNHQYLGVNRALESVKQRHEREGKLGVFWHTQGSGKSYSIVFFAQKIHRKLGGNFSFLILTDRDDLDTQIYKTFAGCDLVDHDKDPCRADSGSNLKALLGQHKSYVFSLIQKFNKDVKPEEPYSHRDDIIVITDEAHRTQYGTLSLNMRNALPNASFIGFTGTPLFSDDEITRKVFGDYISTYDFQRAVDDNATLPLYYDSRGELLVFKDKDGNEHSVADPKGINEKIAEKLEEYETDDVDVQQKLERELKRDYHIITSGSRLNQIAEDFVEHYANGWESGKAMFVCIDKITCVRMHKLIDFYWDEKVKQLEKQIHKARDEQDEVWRLRQIEWMKETEIAVVVSEEQGELAKFQKWDLDITPHRQLMKQGFLQEDGKRLDMESAFKKSDHPFRVAIVCAMWLTGFDVPTLSTLYLDKPLKAHTLMQAIARANRVAEGKNNGLIVDYCGILKNLRKALATFAGRGDKGKEGDTIHDPGKPKEELLKELKEAIALTRQFLQKQGFELDALLNSSSFAQIGAIVAAKDAVNENDKSRKGFEILARNVFKKFKACINVPGVNTFRKERDAINIIYKRLQNDKEQADITHIIRALHGIVDDAVDVARSVREPGVERGVFDISKIDFDLLRKEFAKSKGKRTTVQNMKESIEKKLDVMMRQNPLRTDFREYYEKVIEEYNNEKDRVTIEKTFEDLMKFYEDLTEEEQRAKRSGMDEEIQAVFDLLKKGKELDRQEIQLIKHVAQELLDTLKSRPLKVANWKYKESTRDAVRQHIYDFLYDEKTGLPVDDYTDADIGMKTHDVYRHVWRVYPTLPSPVYNA